MNNPLDFNAPVNVDLTVSATIDAAINDSAHPIWPPARHIGQ